MSLPLVDGLDVVALGDINLDWVVDQNLDFRWRDLVENGRTVLGSIRESPGGSGFNFTRFANEAGLRAGLVGVIGDDIAGRIIMAELQRLGVAYSVRTETAGQTGRCLIARDAADIRFLVNTKANANHGLSAQDIDRVAAKIQSARAVYISGFCVRDPTDSRYQATRRLLRCIADRRPTPSVIFDVVPHRIYETYSWSDFQEITSSITVLISEVSTMRRFIGVGHKQEIVDQRMAEETVRALQPYYRAMILRYGPSGCDEELLWDETTGCLQHHVTGHSQAADKRGFGDRMAIRALKNFFKLL